MDKLDSATSLLVDDQASFRKSYELACKLLRVRDYVLFETSEDMLDKLPEAPNSINLCLVDWNLKTSRKVGGVLLKELVDKMPHSRIYVCSTSENDDEMLEAKEAGAHGWISKNNLIATLRKFLAEYKDINEFHVWK